MLVASVLATVLESGRDSVREPLADSDGQQQAADTQVAVTETEREAPQEELASNEREQESLPADEEERIDEKEEHATVHLQPSETKEEEAPVQQEPSEVKEEEPPVQQEPSEVKEEEPPVQEQPSEAKEEDAPVEVQQPSETADEKPQPAAQDVPADYSHHVTEEEAEPKHDASCSESEEISADMSQRRSRKRQSSGTASAALVGGISPGASDGADGILEASLPSLKAELATADKHRESDGSEDFLDAERTASTLPNGTQEEPAPAEGEGQPVGAPSIGEAIAEARSKLTESLGAAVAAAAGQQGPNSAAQQVPERREHLYKILVIGELGTGKTSIIKRYVHQFFSQHYRATIGVDFALKVLNWDANTIIRLQMWDIAGQERFGNMTRVYYKEAVGAFIVFDVTRVATFDAVLKWKQDLDSKVTLPDGSPIPCVLLANKCDQQKEGLVNNPTKMDEYCKEKGFSAWYETSAKENINIDEAARTLVKKILQNDQLTNQNETAKDTDKINLEGKNGTKRASRCSC